jgi:hypothetical protein
MTYKQHNDGVDQRWTAASVTVSSAFTNIPDRLITRVVIDAVGV